MKTDRESRLQRALLSLDGLSVGDSFGERFFGPAAEIRAIIEMRAMPVAPWRYTDDTEMALSIVDELAERERIEPARLAFAFARRWKTSDPCRGYGSGAHEILDAISRGIPWEEAAGSVFDGQGSMGNGGGMRAAPLGAWFAADGVETTIAQARASARVTHAHPEGQAGAIAVAAAALFAVRRKDDARFERKHDLLSFVAAHTPEGLTREGIERARLIPFSSSPFSAAASLGSGQLVTAQDTVPFSLWCAARHADDFVEAMWATVSGLGDRDTTCAIAGGIVALSAGAASLPASWLEAREPLAR